METIYHTSNNIPILGFFISLILISGFYSLGNIFCKKFNIDKIISKVSDVKYQYVLIGVNITILIIYPIVLFSNDYANPLLLVIAYFLIILGAINFFELCKNINLKSGKISKKYNILSLLIFLGIFLYFLISSSPITNADSLDYHLFLGKKIVENGKLLITSTHFHSHLFGIGESLIALGILVGSEQLGSIVQFFGLVSIIGLIIKKNNKEINIIAYLIGSPVLIFFLSTIKPQFFFIASNALVFCLILFTNIKNNKTKITMYVLSLFLLGISAQAKFSFMLSLLILGTFILFESYRNKIFYKIILKGSIVLSLVFLPALLWKINFYNTDIFTLITKPFPIDDTSMLRFKGYLVNAGKGGNIFKGIIYPDGLNDITNSLGLGSLLIFVLFKKIKQNLSPIILISSFIIISFILGQPSSRFFFEPFTWIILTISFNNIKDDIPYFFDKLIKLQYILFLPAIIYGAFNLFPGVFSDNQKDKVLTKYANGYGLFKWANNEFDKLNYNGHVITMHRSISLLKTDPISMDFIYFTDIRKKEYKKYLDEILELNPKYILSTNKSNEKWKKFFIKCDLKLIAQKEKVGFHATRKPFHAGSYYTGQIYSINLSKKPNCIKKY